MKELKIIREQYKPIQPTARADGEEVMYREIRPEPGLENLVYCYWQLKSRKKLVQDFVYRVVSDGCIDIFFNHTQTTENFVMGFCRKFTEFPIGKSFDYIGIRFLPSVFPLLFEVNAKTLSDQSQELNKIVPEFSNWITKELRSTESFESIVLQLNDQLKLVAKRDFEIDKRFISALNLIFIKKGFLDIQKDLNTGLSPRQLRRIFNFYIGTTAKSFSNVVRFQHIINAQACKQSLKDNKAYLDAGFFDQAHFIKSFKTYYGLTPSQALD